MKKMLLLAALCLGLCSFSNAQEKEKIELPPVLMEKLNTEIELRITAEDLITKVKKIGGDLRAVVAEINLRNLERKYWEYAGAITKLRQTIAALFAAADETYKTFQAEIRAPDRPTDTFLLTPAEREKQHAESARYIALGNRYNALRAQSSGFLRTMNAELKKINDDDTEAVKKAQDILYATVMQRLGHLTGIEQESRLALIALCVGVENKPLQQCHRQYVPDWPPK